MLKQRFCWLLLIISFSSAVQSQPELSLKERIQALPAKFAAARQLQAQPPSAESSSPKAKSAEASVSPVQAPAATKEVETEKQRKQKYFACYEAGRALVRLLQPEAAPLKYVTLKLFGIHQYPWEIVSPFDVRHPDPTKAFYVAEIKTCLAGREAVKLIFNIIVDFARDLQAATRLAKEMVEKLGFSDLGKIWVDKKMLFAANNEGLAKASVDILAKARIETRQLLITYQQALEAVTKELLLKKELTAKQLAAIIVNAMPDSDFAKNLKVKKTDKKSKAFSQKMLKVLNKLWLTNPINLAAVSKRKRERTAYHEAGHALVALLDKDAGLMDFATVDFDLLAKRGGYVRGMDYLHQQYPLETKKYLLSYIRSCLAGTVAEELKFGTENFDNGSASDLKQATNSAKNVINTYEFYGVATDLSDSMKQKVDARIFELLAAEYENTKKFLTLNSKQWHALAKELMQQHGKKVSRSQAEAAILQVAPQQQFNGGASSEVEFKHSQTVSMTQKDKIKAFWQQLKEKFNFIRSTAILAAKYKERNCNFGAAQALVALQEPDAINFKRVFLEGDGVECDFDFIKKINRSGKEAIIRFYLAGKIAAEIAFGEENSTHLTRKYLPSAYQKAREIVEENSLIIASESQKEQIEKQAFAILNTQTALVKAQLIKDRAKLDALAKELFDKKSLTRERALEIIGRVSHVVARGVGGGPASVGSSNGVLIVDDATPGDGSAGRSNAAFIIDEAYPRKKR